MRKYLFTFLYAFTYLFFFLSDEHSLAKGPEEKKILISNKLAASNTSNTPNTSNASNTPNTKEKIYLSLSIKEAWVLKNSQTAELQQSSIYWTAVLESKNSKKIITPTERSLGTISTLKIINSNEFIIEKEESPMSIEGRVHRNMFSGIKKIYFTEKSTFEYLKKYIDFFLKDSSPNNLKKISNYSVSEKVSFPYECERFNTLLLCAGKINLELYQIQ